ncbi:MAG: hypothetical protein IKJ55_03645 [Clostridia bacterium]|nr:hypothetical protein [Clostridia bacterium]
MEKQLYFSPTTFTVEAPFCLVAGDANAYTLVFHAEEPVYGKMLISADRADGETVTDIAEFTGKICRYTMCNAMYEIPGPLSVSVSVQSDNTILTSNRLVFRVLPAPNTGTVEADDRYPVLTKLILETKEAYESAENALHAILETRERLLPQASAEQAGSILCLKEKETPTLRYFTADLENNSESITDAGILNNDTVFIELSADLFGDITLKSDDAIFGFTFIPVETDTSCDYDVIAQEIIPTETGYIFTFPIESCPLLESVTEVTLFDVFESIRINGEYFVRSTKAAWETPDRAIPADFLEQNAVLPALEQAKAYTDQKFTEAKAHTDTLENNVLANTTQIYDELKGYTEMYADQKASELYAEMYSDLTRYTDNSIYQAILDSWEVAV